MKIDKTLEKCGELAGKMLQDYKSEILEAIRETDDEEKVRLAISFDIEPQSSSEFELTAFLRFTKKKYADKVTVTVNELQLDMFEEEADAETK